MRASTLWKLTVLFVSVCGCSDDKSEALVRGSVVRVNTATSFNEAISLGADSVARVGLYANPALGGEGTSRLLVERVFSPAPALPFDFELTGPRPSASGGDQHHVQVEIKQHASAKTVGDLVNAALNVVTPPADDVVVEVEGLESCEAANAGGFCL
jgi:hypothetical protein